MKTKATFIMLWAFLLLTINAFSQAPQKFNYQAVVRDDAGNLVSEQPVSIKISVLQGTVDGTVVYSETHTPTTNSFGLVTLEIGGGTVVSGDLSTVDWGNNTYFMKVEMDATGGTSYAVIGTSQLLSVPYALNAETVNELKKLDIVGDASAHVDSALFEVKRNDGQTVFAVYNEGIRAYVDDSDTKGPKGGFAIGGIKPGKGITNEFFRVTPDSIRMYINDEGAKGTKGGFAIGGFSPVKGMLGDFMNVSGTSIAEVINPSEPRLLWYPNKEAFLTGRVLIESPDSVGANSTATGFESKAIGDYSQALGYQAIAREDYSTAIGYQAVANSTNSFAFGQWANAKNEESYAFGRGAIAEGFRSFAFGSAGIDSAGVETGVAHAIGDYSFAIGQGSIASGKGSFTLGLADTASGDFSTAIGHKASASGYFSTAIGRETKASANYSTVVGYESKAIGPFSTALGYETTASGPYSITMGHKTTTSGFFSTAMGNNTTASDNGSTAMGVRTTASGVVATAMGNETTASGNFSTAMGDNTTARSYSCLAIGSYNRTLTTSSPDYWIATDPVFIIGNGYSYWGSSYYSNALTVLKNGNVGIGNTKFPPSEMLDVGGNTRIDGEIRQGSNDYGAYEIQTGGQIYTNDYLVAMGGVHVGGTSDPGTNNLVVDGKIRQSGIDYGAYEIQTMGKIYANNYLIAMGGIHVGGASAPGIDNLLVDGNVGIGSSTPNAKLDIVATGDGASILSLSTERPWVFEQEGTGSGTALRLRNISSKKLYIDTDGGTQWRSADGSTVFFSINQSNGKVGIGTSAPQTPLAIVGLTGTTSGSYLRIWGSNVYYASSSRKNKKDIVPLTDDFHKILNAKPVAFTDKVSGERNIGYIAEEFDEIGLDNLVVYEDGEAISLSYELVSLYNLEIIKEQQKVLDQQETVIEELKQEIEKLKEVVGSQ